MKAPHILTKIFLLFHRCWIYGKASSQLCINYCTVESVSLLLLLLDVYACLNELVICVNGVLCAMVFRVVTMFMYLFITVLMYLQRLSVV